MFFAFPLKFDFISPGLLFRFSFLLAPLFLLFPGTPFSDRHVELLFTIILITPGGGEVQSCSFFLYLNDCEFRGYYSLACTTKDLPCISSRLPQCESLVGKENVYRSPILKVMGQFLKLLVVPRYLNCFETETLTDPESKTKCLWPFQLRGKLTFCEPTLIDDNLVLLLGLNIGLDSAWEFRLCSHEEFYIFLYIYIYN